MKGVAWIVAAGLVSGCSSGGPPAAPAACSGAATACLSGTAGVAGFTASAQRLEVNLFREFPAAGAVPLMSTSVLPGGTFAFSELAPWEHYYIQVQADFGQPVAPAVFVGPLGVPTSAPVDILVKPVQLSVLEHSAPGASMEVQSALAYVFDPSSGAPEQDATVTIAVGGTPMPMVWTAVTPGVYGYAAAFPSSTAAQSTYTITAAAPGATAATSWQLVSDVPTFSPTLSSPPSGAVVPVNQALTVSWPEQPDSDEEIVQLFAQESGVWSSVFRSPVPDDSDAVTETIPSTDVGPAGPPLLLNVAFLSGSCPPSADGCVVAETIVAEQITAQ